MPSERVQRRIDTLLDEADEAVGKRDWSAVREICDSVLRLDHENEDALTFLEAADHDTGVAVSDQPLPQTTAAPSAEDDTPTSFANGRYKVTGFLGEGGKKKVYLCHDTTLDRDVAFGLIKATVSMMPHASASSAKRRPWPASATTRTSCPSLTSAKRTASHTWSVHSWAAAMLRR